MARIKFDSGANNWTASKGRVFPVDDPLKVNVVSDYSDGGQLYAYDKGPAEQFFNLTFENLVTADDTTLRNWFANIANGVLNTFTFTDEDGNAETVRWIDDKYPLREFKDGFFSGTIRLRKEI